MWWRSDLVVCADPIAGSATRTVARTTWIAFMTVFSREVHSGFDRAAAVIRRSGPRSFHAVAKKFQTIFFLVTATSIGALCKPLLYVDRRRVIIVRRDRIHTWHRGVRMIDQHYRAHRACRVVGLRSRHQR